MHRTRIKICGITTTEAAACAAENGADAIGFVFHRRSPRHIKPEEAFMIIAGLPPLISTVGLFVNRNLEEFCKIEEECPTDWSQLHGIETEEVVQECGPRIFKAVRFDPETIRGDLEKWDSVSEVEAILVDGSPGGEGIVLDWKGLAAAIDEVKPETRIILAGGLTPENVGEAIATVSPWAVDVSSGVESEPGKKDLKKIEAFCDAVRRADAMG